MIMDFSRFSVLTFDCYGTLIDWESGLLQALRPVFGAHQMRIPDEKALILFAELEAEAEKGEFRTYKEVLKTVLRGFGERLKFDPYPGELQSFALSVGDWKPFSDSVAALRQLKRRFRLGILSNVDDDLFAHSAAGAEGAVRLGDHRSAGRFVQAGADQFSPGAGAHRLPARTGAARGTELVPRYPAGARARAGNRMGEPAHGEKRQWSDIPGASDSRPGGS